MPAVERHGSCRIPPAAEGPRALLRWPSCNGHPLPSPGRIFPISESAKRSYSPLDNNVVRMTAFVKACYKPSEEAVDDRGDIAGAEAVIDVDYGHIRGARVQHPQQRR